MDVFQESYYLSHDDDNDKSPDIYIEANLLEAIAAMPVCASILGRTIMKTIIRKGRQTTTKDTKNKLGLKIQDAFKAFDEFSNDPSRENFNKVRRVVSGVRSLTISNDFTGVVSGRSLRAGNREGSVFTVNERNEITKLNEHACDLYYIMGSKHRADKEINQLDKRLKEFIEQCKTVFDIVYDKD